MNSSLNRDKNTLGSHYIAEYHDCNTTFLDTREYLETIMMEAAGLSGATIIQPFFHSFSPQGVSGVIVIAESHFSIHTWPEYGYAAVDLFSCGLFDFNRAFRHIKEGLEAGNMSLSVVERGLLRGGATVPDRLVLREIV